MTSSRFLRAACCAAWLLALTLGGCGPTTPSADLSGSVTVDGKAVEAGTMTFTPLDGPGTSVTTKIEAGKFRQAGVPVGKLRVHFYATRETGNTIMTHGFPEKEVVNVIPDRYSGGMEIQVSAGPGTQDFPLTTKP